MPTDHTASAPPRRDPALDGLRGVAVLLVFLFHYGGGLHVEGLLPHLVGSVTQAGWIGVELFFALSGFLITSILLETPRRPNARRNFFARRALRILPLYAFALLACGAAALLAGAHVRALAPLAIYAVFLQNLPHFVNAALHTPSPLPVFHLWSLAVEEQFYLIWPFAVMFLQSPERVRRASLGVFIVVFLARCLIFGFAPWKVATLWAASFPVRGGSLALGSALAAQRKAAIPATRQRGWLYALAALATFAILGLQLHSFLLDSPLAFCLLLPAASVLSVCTVAQALQQGSPSPLLTFGPLAGLGRISYGVYVFHILLQPAFDVMARAITHSSNGLAYQAVRLTCALPLTIAVATLSFRLLEQPFLRLKTHFPEPAAAVGRP